MYKLFQRPTTQMSRQPPLTGGLSDRPTQLVAGTPLQPARGCSSRMRWSVHGSAGVLLNEQLTGAHPRPLCRPPCMMEMRARGRLLDRLDHFFGPGPRAARPVWSTRRVEHGGQRREVAMGKGLPGGRRQAGSIDYRTEPWSFVAPDRPRRAAAGAAVAAAAASGAINVELLRCAACVGGRNLRGSDR